MPRTRRAVRRRAGRARPPGPQRAEHGVRHGGLPGSRHGEVRAAAGTEQAGRGRALEGEQRPYEAQGREVDVGRPRGLFGRVGGEQRGQSVRGGGSAGAQPFGGRGPGPAGCRRGMAGEQPGQGPGPVAADDDRGGGHGSGGRAVHGRAEEGGHVLPPAVGHALGPPNHGPAGLVHPHRADDPPVPGRGRCFGLRLRRGHRRACCLR